jgi:hypothetical protein
VIIFQVINNNERKCVKCGRTNRLTTHHLRTVSLHPKSNAICILCTQCHRKLHFYYPNETLAKRYDTIESIANLYLPKIQSQYGNGNPSKMKKSRPVYTSNSKPKNGRWFPVMEGNKVKYVIY